MKHQPTLSKPELTTVCAFIIPQTILHFSLYYTSDPTASYCIILGQSHTLPSPWLPLSIHSANIY